MANWADLLLSERAEVVERWRRQETANAALAVGAAEEVARLRSVLETIEVAAKMTAPEKVRAEWLLEVVAPALGRVGEHG